MQQRLELVVCQAGAIEIRHKRADRLPPSAAAHSAHRPRRRVLVLVGARIEIEINAADQLSRFGVFNVEIQDLVMPDRDRALLESDAVEALADVEHPVDRRHGRKILSELFLIDGVSLLAQPLPVKHHVPALDLRAFQLAQLFQVAQLGVGHRALHIVEKPRDGLRVLHHPPLRHVMRVARHLVQAGDLFSKLNDLVENRQIALRSPVRVGDVVALPRLGALGIHHEGNEVGIVESDDDVPLGVLRHTIEIRRR